MSNPKFHEVCPSSVASAAAILHLGIPPIQSVRRPVSSSLCPPSQPQLPPSLWTCPLARSNLRPCEQRSARNQGPAGTPRRRCLGCHGYSSWPPFAASSSGSSGRRRWPLCLEPLHLLHRAGALARAQAPGRRPRVSLPDPAAVGTPGAARAMDRSESLPWSSATSRIQCPEGQIRPSPTALARIPSSLPVSASPPSLAVLYVFTPWKPASLFPRCEQIPP